MGLKRRVDGVATNVPTPSTTPAQHRHNAGTTPAHLLKETSSSTRVCENEKTCAGMATSAFLDSSTLLISLPSIEARRSPGTSVAFLPVNEKVLLYLAWFVTACASYWCCSAAALDPGPSSGASWRAEVSRR